MDSDKIRKPVEFSGEQASGGNSGDSSLLPMLIIGLVLIFLGYSAIMIFV